MSTSSPIDLIARLEARHGRVQEAVEILRQYGNYVRTQPGTLRFEVYQDSARPYALVVIERYIDDEAFNAHLADPENARVNERLASFTKGGSSLQMLRSTGTVLFSGQQT